MRHHLLFSSAAAAMPSSSVSCKHNHHYYSPSATLDLIILILVLISGTFLITSYISYIFHSLSLLLSPQTSPFPHTLLSLSLTLPNDVVLPLILGFIIFFVFSLVLLECFCWRSRKCEREGCRGLKKAMEFDLQLQTEDMVKSAAWREVDRLPWKGGSEENGDYECLRAELRKMAPPNGRAVLLFRAKCGCPVAKLEGWGPKRGKRHKK